MKFLILGLLACFVAAAWADEGDIYFEASGDGATGANNPNSPFDDEDSDEASGDDEDTEVEIIDTEDEPEVNGTTEKPQETKGQGSGINRIVKQEEPEEEPEKEVDENGMNAAEQEGGDGDKAGAGGAGASTQFMAAVIVGGCIGLLFAICVIMLLVYRMRKKDEGSYALEYGLDSKKPQGNYDYTKGVDSKEYFA